MGIPTREEMYKALAERHGDELQAKISKASVVVCGLGGLGSNVCIALARAGVEKLHLIDFDRVDISNLNRQQYFPEQLGMLKTDALADTLNRISPYCEIKTDCVKLTEDNISEYIGDEEIICEAFDNAESKAVLVNYVLENMPEKYIVSASGMAGISTANTIKTRRITEHFFMCGDGESDVADGLGLVASRVMVCAAHEANMILRIIAGEKEA